MVLILAIKLLNVSLEKILKSEQFLTDKGNLLNSFAALSWNQIIRKLNCYFQ